MSFLQEDKIKLILDELIQAQSIALTNFGIENILQPGIIKELIMARVLGHKPVPKKRDADAVDDEGNLYEYLSSIVRTTKNNKGSSFQVDRVTADNLQRITRNKCFYFGFFKDNLNILEIWRVETDAVLAEVQRQLTLCKNKIAHVNFLTKWVHSSGTKVHPQ